jgi:endonuclease/exonuclease/phosphatase (EEP) superfamily protein YafD
MTGKSYINLKVNIWRVLFCFTCLGGLATIAGFFGKLSWLFEIPSHFRVQYLFCLLPFLIAFLIGKKYKFALVAGLFVLINAVTILPLYFGSTQVSPRATRLRAMLLNVNSANHQHDRVVDVIRQENPDFFLVMEVTGTWLDKLTELLPEYQYKVSRARHDNFGIAFFSRLEPEKMEIQQIGSSVPSVLARLKYSNGSLTVIGTHPLPPVGADYAFSRNRQISELAQMARQISGPLVLLGDLNMTSWSPHFSDLLEGSNLRDSRQGFGVQPSWPDGLFFLYVPIDHCLVSKEIEVADRRVGPSIGSDHFPVTIDLALVPANL